MAMTQAPDTLRIAVAQLNPTVGDIKGNLAKAREARAEAARHGADIVLFTELFIAGYPPEDLVLRPVFVMACEKAVMELAAETADGGPGVIIGVPLRRKTGLHNAVMVLDGGKVIGERYKQDLPNYSEFDEKRVFQPGPMGGPVNFRGVRLGIPVCEDIWGELDVCETLAESGAEMLLVPNGSPYYRQKIDVRHQVAIRQVIASGLPLLYANQFGGQDELIFDGASFGINADKSLAFQMSQFEETCVVTTWKRRRAVESPQVAEMLRRLPANMPMLDLSNSEARELLIASMKRGHVSLDELNRYLPATEVTSDDLESLMEALTVLGINVIEKEVGALVQHSAVEGFDGWHCERGPMSVIPDLDESDYRACMLGLRDYVNKSGFKDVVLGLSGGIDSAICAALAVDALGEERVRCIMMPYEYTSKDSLTDAETCAQALGCRYDVVPIFKPVEGFLSSLEPLFEGTKQGITEENLQSRTRGTLLMAVSNKFGSMVVTTGNKSEMSVGYCTLYGDMNGGFNPIKDLYKMQVYKLAAWRNDNVPPGALGPSGKVIPQNIIDKAPSAELRPNQTDQDSLPPYPVLDDILEGLVEQDLSRDEIMARGHDKATVERIEHLLYLAEYKRRQAAPGVKITRKYFGRDRRYPITNRFRDR